MTHVSDQNENPRGVIVPLFTPLSPRGDVDEGAGGRLIDHLLRAGVDGLFILGSTGEGHSLSTSQQYRFAEFVVDHVGSRTALYLGLLQPGTQQMIEFALHCPSLEQFSAVVAGVPTYRFATNSIEVLDHFRRVLKDVEKPLMVYHLPHPASEILGPELAVRLAELEGVIGWKDSSGRSDCLQALIDSGSQQRGFRIYEGGPERSLASLRLGCDGLIPGPGNFIPHLLVQLFQAFQGGDLPKARDLQVRIDEFRQFARQRSPFVESGFHFSTFKAGLDIMGVGGGTPAPPFQRLPDEFRDRLRPFFEAVDAHV